MAQKDITSMRSTIEFLKEQDEILVVDGEVDPIYEIAAIEKALEGGPAILFENIKGYPGVRDIGNVFSRDERTAKIFGVADHRKIKFACLEAIKNPLPPRVVEDAPCQEVVITEDIDVMATLPMIKSTEIDGGRILGSANNLIGGKYFQNAFHVSFNRVHFRGKDWATVLAGRLSHLGDSILAYKGEKIPMTINICTPPAVAIAAGGARIPAIIPSGADDLGFAGRLQGRPVDICKAKTVDAYAIANSEWVIEGYVDASQKVWETEESEKVGIARVTPFFPEWPGYMGRAGLAWKFEATAITHRTDRPIFYTPLADSFEGVNLINRRSEAAFYEVAQRSVSGLVIDVNIWPIMGRNGVIFQVSKKSSEDDQYIKHLIAAAFGARQGLYWVVVVDEDIDIYSVDDVIWALITRVNPDTDIVRGYPGKGRAFMPIERVRMDIEQGSEYHFPGGFGFDATAPFAGKWAFERPHYLVDKVNLRKWFTQAQIDAVQALQSDYAKVVAKQS